MPGHKRAFSLNCGRKTHLNSIQNISWTLIQIAFQRSSYQRCGFQHTALTIQMAAKLKRKKRDGKKEGMTKKSHNTLGFQQHLYKQSRSSEMHILADSRLNFPQHMFTPLIYLLLSHRLLFQKRVKTIIHPHGLRFF